MSKSSARSAPLSYDGEPTSIRRIALAVLLLVAGVAWLVVYTNVAMDHALWVKDFGMKEPANPIPWMADLKRWNYLIGFGLVIASLWVAAHETTPLGRGRGVVIGMLGSAIIGLIWIVLFYLLGDSANIPVLNQLGNYNLMLGMAFIATSFAFATRWK